MGDPHGGTRAVGTDRDPFGFFCRNLGLPRTHSVPPKERPRKPYRSRPGATPVPTHRVTQGSPSEGRTGAQRLSGRSAATERQEDQSRREEEEEEEGSAYQGTPRVPHRNPQVAPQEPPMVPPGCTPLRSTPGGPCRAAQERSDCAAGARRGVCVGRATLRPPGSPDQWRPREEHRAAQGAPEGTHQVWYTPTYHPIYTLRRDLTKGTLGNNLGDPLGAPSRWPLGGSLGDP